MDITEREEAIGGSTRLNRHSFYSVVIALLQRNSPTGA
jgi:hypothetical protein